MKSIFTKSVLEKSILICLLLRLLIDIPNTYSFINNQFSYYFIALLSFYNIDISIVSNLIVNLLYHSSILLILIGFIIIFRRKKIELNKYLKLSIYLFFVHETFLYVSCLFSNSESILGRIQHQSFLLTIYKVGILLLYLLIIIYFYKNEQNKTTDSTESVENKGRFINRVIDILLVLSYVWDNIRIISHDFIFQDNEFLNSNPYWLIALFLFIYYFSMEFLFGKTLGKLHNRSFVIYEKSRFLSILWRTLARFIPFEAFSFLDHSRWHDAISKTDVVTHKK